MFWKLPVDICVLSQWWPTELRSWRLWMIREEARYSDTARDEYQPSGHIVLRLMMGDLCCLLSVMCSSPSFTNPLLSTPNWPPGGVDDVITLSAAVASAPPPTNHRLMQYFICTWHIYTYTSACFIVIIYIFVIISKIIYFSEKMKEHASWQVWM